MQTAERMSRLGTETAFKVLGDGVLQLLSLLVHLVPFHAEDFGGHSLNQMMALMFMNASKKSI